MKSIVLLGVLSASLLSPLHAQGLKLRMRMLAFKSSIEFAEAFAQDPAAEPTAASTKANIKGYLNRESVTVSLKSNKVVFTTKPDRPSMTRDGETIAEVAIPGRLTTALLFFLPSKAGGKTKSQVMVIDDSKRAFPAGSFNITNLSPNRVKLVLQGKEFDYPPGNNGLITDIPADAQGQIGVKAWALVDNKPVEILSSIWTKPKETRSVMAFYVDEDGTLRLAAFDDVSPQDPPPPVP